MGIRMKCILKKEMKRSKIRWTYCKWISMKSYSQLLWSKYLSPTWWYCRSHFKVPKKSSKV